MKNKKPLRGQERLVDVGAERKVRKKRLEGERGGGIVSEEAGRTGGTEGRGNTPMPNDKFAAVGANIQEKAAMIWNVADLLRGPFKPHEYGLVILPMTVVKRFHDCLLPTHGAVLETWEKVKQLAVTDGFLRTASGYQFYNTSRFTFERLLADPENVESNFRD